MSMHVASSTDLKLLNWHQSFDEVVIIRINLYVHSL